MKPKLNILIIDDSEDDRELYHRLLKKNEDFDLVISEAETGAEGLEKYCSEVFHCVLLDYSLKGHNGLNTLVDLKDHDTHASVIMLTGQGNETIAVQAMRNGAQDYLVKGDINAQNLQRAVHTAIERVDMVRKLINNNKNSKDFLKGSQKKSRN